MQSETYVPNQKIYGDYYNNLKIFNFSTSKNLQFCRAVNIIKINVKRQIKTIEKWQKDRGSDYV